MRKLLFLALLATVATPALAQRDRGGDGQRGPRVERSQSDGQPGGGENRGNWQARGNGGEARSNGGEARGNWQVRGDVQRPERQWRGGGFSNDRPAVQVQSPPAQRGGDGVARERFQQRFGQQGNWSQPVTTAPVNSYRQRIDTDRQRDSGIRTYDGRQRDGAVRNYDGRQWDSRRVSGWNGTPANQRWSNNWRQNPQYNWRNYRDRNRSIFRVGSFYDPFGYGYRPLSIGFTLYSGYYQPNYWLDDPWQYRLPPVYGPYRWVRYWNDAVLIDIYTGEVVDVIRNFFW